MTINQEMEEDQEKESDNIFPILNRNTPIIDRIKNRRNQFNGSSDNILAEQIARSALTGEPLDEDYLNNLKVDIADELDISEEQINGMFISRVRDVLSPSLEDLISRAEFNESESTNNEIEKVEDQETEQSQDEIVDEEEEINENQEQAESSTPSFPDEEESDADQIF